MKDILVFDSLLSTNLYLQENCIALPNKQIVIAKHQTAGRGRGANCWLDEENTNLLISFLFKEEKDLFLSGLLSLVMGFSLHKTLRKYLANEIKWPNDIYWKSKKLENLFSPEVRIMRSGSGKSGKYKCCLKVSKLMSSIDI